jgi:hypothetical protein
MAMGCLLVVGLLGAPSVLAQDITLSVGLVESLGESNVTVPIRLDVVTGSPAAIVLDVRYENLLVSVTGVTALTPLVDANKSLDYEVIVPGVVRIVMGGANQDEIASGFVAEIDFELNLAGAKDLKSLAFASIGATGEVTLDLLAENVSAADKDAASLAVTVKHGGIITDDVLLPTIPAAGVIALFVLGLVLLVSLRYVSGARRVAVLVLVGTLLAVTVVAARTAGDLDDSGTADAADLALFINAVLGQVSDVATDLDFSGVTDARDFQLLVLSILGVGLDSDSDGILDAVEEALGTNPLLEDSDADGVSDYDELISGADPLNARPVITVTDPGVNTVEAGGSWVDPGATALDVEEGSVPVTVGGDVVDPNAAVGTVFVITYDAVDAEEQDAAPVLRAVTVVDTTAPVISVTSPAVITVEAGEAWTELGATALDNADGLFAATVGGDTVDSNASLATVFTITYDATDAAGNVAAQVTREVTVVPDLTPPLITLTSPGTITVLLGEAWVEPGATAVDTVDGAVAVTIGGDTVNSNAAAGTVFVVRYDAVDAAGNNATQVTRTVTVVSRPVLINEFAASTDVGYPDEDGEFEDWIELYNPNDVPINLSGWSITDDRDDTEKWVFPNVTIGAGEYLVVFASGKDRAVAGSELHTNFSLSRDGEYLGLYNTATSPLAVSEFSPLFPKQVADMSYGWYEADSAFRIFSVPTPGAANVNNGEIFNGLLTGLTVSPPHGFYDAAFPVTITTPIPGTTIKYTLDGSTPSLDNGTVYSAPFQTTETSVVRVAAFKDAWLPSDVITNTYLFLSDVITQQPNGESPPGWPSGMVNEQVLDFGMDPRITESAEYAELMDDALLALPSLSIATELGNLVDPETGIYVNAVQDGREWERPISLELINPDGSEGFQVGAGLRIRGNSTRAGEYSKHAWRLFFREEYGEGKLEYPLFGDEGTDTFDKMDLRTTRTPVAGGFLHDIFSRDSQRDLGQPYTRSRFYHLYLNGVYWGIFQSQERSEANYGKSYLGGEKEDFDVIKGPGANDGNTDGWVRLGNTTIAGFDSDETYYGVQGMDIHGVPDPDTHERLIDIDSVIAYQLIMYYTGNLDASPSVFVGDTGSNNYYWMYNRENPDGFKLFAHDAETTMRKGPWFDPAVSDELYRDRTGPFTGFDEFGEPIVLLFPFPPHFRMCDPCQERVWAVNPDTWNPQWAHMQLMAHPEYKMAFADAVHRQFFNGGVFTPEANDARWMSRASEIDVAIIAESARWGDTRGSELSTRNEAWLEKINSIRYDYFPFRTDIVFDQIKARGWYPATDAPVFVEQHGGLVPATPFTLTIDNPGGSGTIYYTLDGSDPRGPANFGAAPTPPADPPFAGAAEEAAKTVLVPTSAGDLDQSGTPWTDPAFNDSTWTSGTGGVGYEKGSGYEDFFDIDVIAEMDGINSSAFVRIPFNLTAQEVADASCMTLRVRYDDGFIAYVNGTEVASDNAPATPAWDSGATALHDDGVATTFVDFTLDAFLGELVEGANLLAIHGLNAGVSSSDFLISVELEVVAACGDAPPVEPIEPVIPIAPITPDAIAYSGPLSLTESTHVMARVKNGDDWSALNEATFVAPALAGSLRITELMYHPQDPNSAAEFIELLNVGAQSINLVNTQFTKGIRFTFPNTILAPGEYLLLVKDLEAFAAQYSPPGGVEVLGPYAGALESSGSLNDAGERIRLEDPTGAAILDFNYKDGWKSITDGDGFSLTIIDPTGDTALWDDEDGWRASAVAGGSPGTDDSGLIPEPGSIVINEVLAHSHDGAPDWIELYNTTGSAINIGGWFLSDKNSDVTKYEIAAGTSIPAGGYLVFYEDQHFGNVADPGANSLFALSENGEDVYLSSGSAGQVTGYRDQEDFGASETDVAFGRHLKSTGAFNFVSMSSNTPGTPNAAPKVGPVVISEIMYHPLDPNSTAEYIELQNISGAPVDLYDIDGNPWVFSDGVTYTFPPLTKIPAGGRLLLVRDPAAFAALYSPPGGAEILGPYTGALSNGGERLELAKPGDVDEFGIRHYIRVDRVNYDDIAPWPTAPDGTGTSLTRKVATDYGNDVANWQSASPTPGE